MNCLGEDYLSPIEQGFKKLKCHNYAINIGIVPIEAQILESLSYNFIPWSVRITVLSVCV